MMKKFFDQIRDWIKSCSSIMTTADGAMLKAISVYDALYAVDDAQEKWQEEEIDSRRKNTETICKWTKTHVEHDTYTFVSGCKSRRIDTYGRLFSGWSFCPYCAGKIEVEESLDDGGNNNGH